MRSSIGLAFFLLPSAFAVPAIDKRSSPTVNLQYATVVGSSIAGVDSFKGIPYAQPPVGQLRLKPPQPISSNIGTVQATGIPRACPQFYASTSNLPTSILGTLANTPLLQTVTDAGEDCLTVNVQRPASASASSKLPVVFWIYGGGFQLGSTQAYDGTSLILNSISRGKSVIYVAVNHRVGGFGFMPGKEILADGSANLGHLDQRLALQWVADNIAAFGGDPSKVTIWGESSGSLSVFNQMAAYNGDNTYKGKPLFRAAIMDSGSIIPADPVDCPKGQVVYNTVVKNAGCSSAADTLACLRALDYTTFLNAANSVPGILDYTSVALSYLARPDGTFLTASPDVLAENGQYASVPFIIGDQEDEGTIFSLMQTNLSTTADIVNYLSTYFFKDATVAQVAGLVNTYPENITAGSPFNTGLMNSLYPQYKRLAALLGDIVFTLTRRVFLSATTSVKPNVPTWSYLSSFDYGTPLLGTFHASDVLAVYFGVPPLASSKIQNYYISFFNTMDPNAGTVGEMNWPRWSVGNQLLHFTTVGTELLGDTFRQGSADYINANKGVLHI